MRASRAALLLVLTFALVRAASTGDAQAPPAQRSFENDVQPMLTQVCSRCHNDRRPTAGLNVALYSNVASLATQRDGWELILAKLRAGEMPPAGEEQPSDEQIAALVNFVQGEFDRADRNLKPDPGRVTAHRLNRVEYANTVRDLLGVDFRATDEFPADDSGYGFDNNGDVLTVSPALMQKYLAAAERIASRAVGGDPLPPPGVFTRHDRARRVGDDAIELRETLDYDADYTIKVGLAGHRGEQDPPVALVISVDGKPVKTATVPVQISAVNRQGGSTQRSVQDVRLFLTGNEHRFRAEFVDDEALKNIPVKSRRDATQNIFAEFLDVAGPFPATQPHPAVVKKALTCDPASGAACVDRLLTSLSHRAYRRPVARPEVVRLIRTFDRARTAGYSAKQSVQFGISAMLVSPQFLFRIERDPGPNRVSQVTDVELASRLSYFLWSSMPDDELLKVAEANRLHVPAVLEAQAKRMIADPKSAALAENFAGQWLETRSLDAVKRDATKFPEWTPELRDAMRTETRLFFDAVLRDDRPVSDFINGKYTFLNGLLARHYGIPGVDGPDFRRVELTTDQRGGVFTQASVLTVSSYATRTSVVLRGKYLLDNVLNAPPPPPPPDVPPLDEAKVVAGSQRVQMEQHRSDPFCASCHTRMDPLGFGLENYDATGKWRTAEGKFPIDASGWFPSGKKFSSPEQMKTLLLEAMPDFTRSLGEKMLTYALGRGVESYDRLVVRRLVEETAGDGYRFQTLIQGIIQSPPFQQRRGDRTQSVVQEHAK